MLTPMSNNDRLLSAAESLRLVAIHNHEEAARQAIDAAAYAYGLRYEPAAEPARAMVYIAGPLTHGDPTENAGKAFVTAGWLMKEADRIGLPMGTFIPHAYLACEAVFPRPYEAWMASCDIVLQRCDALFRLPGFSPGSDREEAKARELGIPVFKHTIAEATQMLAYLRSRQR
jgi:hypothetical protein